MKKQMGVVAAALLGAVFTQSVGATAAETFKQLDTDGDGMLTVEEADPNPDLVEAFEDGDENGDGKLDMAEFEKLEISDE